MSEKHSITLKFNGVDYTVRGWPDRPFNAVKVFSNDRYSRWAVNAKGEYFCSLVTGNGYYPRLGRGQVHILEGCARLGMLDRKSVKALRIELERRKTLSETAWSADQMLKYSLACGVLLTKSQLAQVAKLKSKAARQGEI